MPKLVAQSFLGEKISPPNGTCFLDCTVISTLTRPSYDRGVHCPLISTLEMVSKKVRQSTDVTGISIFKQEIKLSQFVDDTNFFCSDVTSAEKYFEYCKRI